MIIWSGMGFLTVLAGIAGAIVSLVLSVLLNAGTGMGTTIFLVGTPILAALFNWILCKLVYPGKPALPPAHPAPSGTALSVLPPQLPAAAAMRSPLRDPSASPSMASPSMPSPVAPPQRSHSLFFIPMKIWTLLYLVCTLPAIGIAIVGLKQDAAPGRAAFDEANDQIDSYDGTIGFGNTAEAVQAAESFAEILLKFKEIGFDGGTGSGFATKGKFLTYCRINDDSVVFLCHVPELRNYKEDKTKDALTQLAWSFARQSVGTHFPDLPPDARLAVGLRGIALYGRVWEGPRSADEPADQSNERHSLYKYFTSPAHSSASEDSSGEAP